MAAANQAPRDAAGIEEVVTAEGMARDYAHLMNCDPDRRHPRRRARRRGSSGTRRVEWRDLDGRHPLVRVDLRARARATPPGHRPGDARLVRGAAGGQGRPRCRTAATVPATMRAFAFGAEPGRIALLETDRLDAHRATATRWSARRSTTSRTCRCRPGCVVRPVGTGRGLAPASGMPAPRPSATTVPSPSRPRRTGRRSSATRTRTRRCGSSPSTATRSPGACWEDRSGRERPPRPRARHLSTASSRGGRGGDAGWPGRSRPVLVRLRDHGMTSAYLGVDGLNPNQAMTLYSSLGFEVASMSIDWTKPLPGWTGVAGADRRRP